MDVSLLKNIPLFADVPDEKLSKIAPFATTDEFAEGEVDGQGGRLLEPLLRDRGGDGQGRARGQHLADLGPGDVFGEQGLLEKQERSATVTATSRLRVIKIEHWELSRMRKSMPEVVEELQRKV